MILQQIRLENFRSYFGTHTIDLATKASGPKNIVMIGGLNGAGKTSLHQAIVMGLVGEQAYFTFVRDLDRKGDARQTIDRELNSLLNREAAAAGEREARVTLFLSDNDGEQLAVQRTWAFDARGVYRGKEELVVARTGTASSSATDDEMTHKHFEDMLKSYVPPEVAKFFFFDGEDIQRIARDNPGTAVGDGVDLLLGFHILDGLASDMDFLHERYRKEAHKRSQQEIELDKLRVVEKELVTQRRQFEDEQQELEERVAALREESRRLVEELREAVGGSGRDPRLVQDELDQVNREIQRARDSIQAAVDQRIVSALPGDLVHRLARQLDAEDARSQWEEGKRRVEPRRDRLIQQIFGEDAPQPTPPLDAAQSAFLQRRVCVEWDNLFNPPPAGIATERRHAYLSDEERNQVRGRCAEVLRFGVLDLNRMIGELDTLQRRATDLRVTLDRIGDGERAAKLVAQKGRIDKELGEAESDWAAKKRQSAAVAVDLKDLRKQISNKEEELDRSGASADRADVARRVRRAVERYKEELRPRKRDELARHLGDMYRHLARKEDVVQRIELDERSFSPRLLDRRGNSISLDSQSAGEREIYALALLWALAQTSKRDLPVVIDTPLARLDSAHRSNIVKHYLPEAGRQVIVLSTDTEIDRHYHELIEDHIAKSFRLEFNPLTERTTVADGYFKF